MGNTGNDHLFSPIMQEDYNGYQVCIVGVYEKRKVGDITYYLAEILGQILECMLKLYRRLI